MRERKSPTALQETPPSSIAELTLYPRPAHRLCRPIAVHGNLPGLTRQTPGFLFFEKEADEASQTFPS